MYESEELLTATEHVISFQLTTLTAISCKRRDATKGVKENAVAGTRTGIGDVLM
jgi:hypothetical protein